MAITFANIDDDRIEIPNEANYDLTGEMTIMAWVKSSGLSSTWDGIVTKGDTSWRLHRNSGSVPEWLNFGNNGVSPTTSSNLSSDIADGEWHLCMGILTSTKRYVIFDASVTSADITGSQNTNNNAVWVSGNSGAAGREWNGELADARIYNRALTLNEAATIYAQRGGDTIVNGLVSRWRMNEATPTTVVTSGAVIDETGLNDGNVNGTPEYVGDILQARRAG